MKRFMVILVSMVLCLGAVGLLVGCGSTDLEARIAQLEQDKVDLQVQLDEIQSTVNAILPPADSTDFKIYEIGETFTYVSAGIPLFSLTVTWHEDIDNYIIITVKNINMPGYAPNHFVRGRSLSSGGLFHSVTLSNTVFAIGSQSGGGGSAGIGEFVWFGFPIGDAIIPYMICRVR